MDSQHDSSFSPRSYQLELLSFAKKQNCIISSPTNSGKTLIAILLAKYMLTQLERVQDIRIVFVVPTRPIASQQADAFEKFLQALLDDNGSVSQGENPSASSTITFKPNVEVLTGKNPKNWKDVLKKTQIICTTAQTFLNNLKGDNVSMQQLHLIIFDECHNAVKSSPMREIMLNHYWKCKSRSTSVPKILGLSASPVAANSLGETLLKMLQLGNDLDACVRTICEPKNWDELRSVVSTPDPELLRVPLSEEAQGLHDRLLKVNQGIYEQILFELERENTAQARELAKHMQKVHQFISSNETLSCHTALSEIDYYLSHEASAQVSKFYSTHQLDVFSVRQQQRNAPKSNQKWARLQELLLDHRGSASTSATHSPACIVFVQTKKECKALCEYLTEKNLKCNYITGEETTSSHQEVLDKFRKSEFFVLVATSVAEEGLDISNCSLVVRLSVPQSALNLIQSRGRGRSDFARFVCIYTTSDQMKNVPRSLRQETLMLEAISLLTLIEKKYKLDPYKRETHVAKMDLTHFFRELLQEIDPKKLSQVSQEDRKLSYDANVLHALLFTTSRKLLGNQDPELHVKGSDTVFRCTIRFNNLDPPLTFEKEDCIGRSKKDAQTKMVLEVCKCLHEKHLLVFPKKHQSNKVHSIVPSTKRNRPASIRVTGSKVSALKALKVENAMAVLNHYCNVNECEAQFTQVEAVGENMFQFSVRMGKISVSGDCKTKKKTAKHSAAFHLMSRVLQEKDILMSSKAV